MLYQFFIEANGEDKRGTSRGLLSLFALGFVPLVLGVTVESFVIDVPWLMTVKVKYGENIFIIYSLVVLLSVYRFYRNNEEIFVKANEVSLNNFLTSRIGRVHLSKIFGIKLKDINGISLQFDHETNFSRKLIAIRFTPVEPSETEFAVLYQVFYNLICFKEYRVPRSVDPAELTPIRLYGNLAGSVEYDTFNEYQKTIWKDLPITTNIYLRLRYLSRALFYDLNSFDVLLPIYVNLVFVNYLVFNKVLLVI